MPAKWREVRMMRYRKKPLVVEVFQLTDDPEYEAPPWFTQTVADERSGLTGA